VAATPSIRVNEEAGASLLAAVRACRRCEAVLPLGPRPILQCDPRARLLIVGQAPGRLAHERGRPFDDPSGERLRAWLGLDRQAFYDARRVALLPMAFCYPGKGPGGDRPPRPECAPAWRATLLASLPAIELTLLLGCHAVRHHLPGERGRRLAEVVAGWRAHAPALLPLPHPSPRNLRWFARNPFFEAELLPWLRARVSDLLRA
jgi:uracil-DNA glycosylase